MNVSRHIPIPARIEDLLDKDEELSTGVKRSLSEYSQWLKKSTLVFFPEYTDHGPTHIADVLTVCDELITDDAYRLLSPADAAALTLAVLLHDIGLHLTQDGFCRLVLGETKLRPIPDLGDSEWPVLWERFREQATRFSGAENKAMFGDPAPVAPPPLDNWNWNNKQNLLVGEFIRRHHPRLAHQIAIHGFPGSEAEVFQLDATLDRIQRDVIGLIARSHGMPLRPCIDYLERNHFDRVHPLGIHAVFLICLLRVGDYLQIQARRASAMKLRMNRLHSTTSIREWEKHWGDTSNDSRRKRS